MRQLIVASIAIALAPQLHAQRGGPGDPGVFTRANVQSEVVKGAPYSAEVVNETSQTLSDGNHIFRRTTSRVYRDSEGRTRREEDRPNGPPGITISDPVAGTSWTLDVDRRTARQSAFFPRVFGGTVNRNGELERLNVLINGQLASFVTAVGDAFVVGRPNGQTVEEKLSPRTIEGVHVEGTRRTMTIPAGAIGNERPIVVTSEEWTSPELKAQLLSESNDPRTGTSTYKLVNLKRAEPAASFFQVPSDYTITQMPGGGEGRGEGRGARGGRGDR
jgi:hypothetical protein